MITKDRKAELAISDYKLDLRRVKAKKEAAYKYLEGMIKLEKILKAAIKKAEEAGDGSR